MPTFAKKLILQFSIQEINENLVQNLNQLFGANAGDNYVTIEVVELEKIKKAIEMPILEVKDEPEIDIEDEPEIDIEDIVDEIGTEELEDIEAIAIDVPPVEEVIVKTRLTMPSRKLKVNISSELLQELEKMQLNFKLN